jgi:hypothetical protein
MLIYFNLRTDYFTVIVSTKKASVRIYVSRKEGDLLCVNAIAVPM